MDGGPEDLEARHAWVMEQHARQMRSSQRRTTWTLAICVFVILLSSVALSLPDARDPLMGTGHYFAFTVVLMAFVVAGLFAEIALLMVSRARAYRSAAGLVQTAYEVGVLVGRSKEWDEPPTETARPSPVPPL